MESKWVGLVAGAGFVLLAGAANADGYYGQSMKDGPLAAPVNWNGLYIGAAVGYGIANIDAEGWADTYWYHGDWSYTGLYNKGLSLDGAQGTITLGYDRQIHPGLLIGIFGDYTFGDLKNESAVSGVYYDDYGCCYEAYPYADLLKTSIGNSWSIGGRIGLVRENTLWYAFAGYSQADLDWSLTAFDWDDWPSSYAWTVSGSEKLKGYFLGLGVERQLFQNVSLKLEYRYTKYDEVTFGGYFYEEDEVEHESSFSFDTDVHAVRLGLNVKFDPFHRSYEPAPLK